MLITFFIGNGFDLNNGMQTKFTDFYDHIKTIKPTEKINNNDIYLNIEKDRDKWSYFEMQLGQLTFDYNEETKSKLLDDIDAFRIDFIEYMTEQNEMFLFDESTAKQLLVKTLTQFMKQLNETEEEDLNSVYYNSTSNRVFNFINFNYTDTLEQIVNIFEKKTSLATYNIGNASYGNYLGDIIPIHKKLQTGMFLGVNDENQINSKIFTETEGMSLIKPVSNEAFRDNTNKKVENIIDKSRVVVIYGMSLGETDKKWWIYLGKWLKENQSNRLIIHIYDDQFSKTNPRIYFEKRKEYEERFLGFSYDINNEELKEEIEMIRKRIYLIPNSNTDFKFSSSTRGMTEVIN